MKHKCPHCQKGFSHFSNMNRHIRLVHEKLVITNKYVNCPTCQKCVQASSLKKHIRTIHENVKDFICEFCHQGFTQKYTLKVLVYKVKYSFDRKLIWKMILFRNTLLQSIRNITNMYVKNVAARLLIVQTMSDIWNLYIKKAKCQIRRKTLHWFWNQMIY